MTKLITIRLLGLRLTGPA